MLNLFISIIYFRLQDKYCNSCLIIGCVYCSPYNLTSSSFGKFCIVFHLKKSVKCEQLKQWHEMWAMSSNLVGSNCGCIVILWNLYLHTKIWCYHYRQCMNICTLYLSNFHLAACCKCTVNSGVQIYGYKCLYLRHSSPKQMFLVRSIVSNARQKHQLINTYIK